MQNSSTNDYSNRDVFKPNLRDNSVRDAQRNRIFDEIVAQCYTKIEFQMAWYRYLSHNLVFPFQADILVKIKNSNEIVTKSIDILALADEDACMDDILVKGETAGEYDYFYLSLLILRNIQSNGATQQAIDDWQYWNSDYF